LWLIVLSIENGSCFIQQRTKRSPPKDLVVDVGCYQEIQRLSFLKVVSRPQDETSTYTSLSTSKSLLSHTIRPFAAFLLYSFLSALLILSWEDYTCSYILPSRARTSLLNNQYWGASTIRGMGFGLPERQRLMTKDDLAQLPSYNELMLQHRQERVKRWNDNASVLPADSIHTLCDCLQAIWKMKNMAKDYQWDALRHAIRAQPISDLEKAASQLRTLDPDNVIGFDWGSCAWRHCGALADATEALDELDAMLGVLEPYEAIFCLDVVERSLRDMLVVVPWEQADDRDAAFWKQVPDYVPHRVYEANENVDDLDAVDMRIDDDYMAALQELRIDDTE